jgi:hypothetical protein
MTEIRVDLDKLRSSAEEIGAVAEKVEAAAVEAGKAALGMRIDPSYADQLAGKLEARGREMLTHTAPITNGLREHATWLQDLAQRFEEADQASVEGLDSLWATSRALLVEYGESPYVMRWLLDGSRPPWIPPREWWQLSKEDRDLIIQGLRRDYANFMAGRTEGSFRSAGHSSSYYEEMFQIYLFGLPANLFGKLDDGSPVQIQPYYNLNHELLDKPRLPDGSSVYLDARGMPRFTKHQYQDLPEYYADLERKELLDQLGLSDPLAELHPTGWSRSHFNLCGLDAVGHAVGAQDMYQIYVNYGLSDEAMLRTGGTMWTYEVRDLYRSLGWEADQIGRFADSDNAHWMNWDSENRLEHPTFSQVEEKLRDGYVVTPLVGVNSGTGHLSSASNSVGHFVNIVETMTTKDGMELVRVYNPMFHREEIYTWSDFDRIWRHAGGNSGGQGVIARPPEPET